jgi:hypothetical protein
MEDNSAPDPVLYCTACHERIQNQPIDGSEIEPHHAMVFHAEKNCRASVGAQHHGDFRVYLPQAEWTSAPEKLPDWL